jgi:iron complex outermembrane receptor protein
MINPSNRFRHVATLARHRSACCRFALWGAFILSVLSCGLSLRAAEPTVNLPPWIVEGHTLHDGTGAPVSQIVTSDAWAGRDTGTLTDFLGHAAGLTMQESFGGFEPPRLSIRGSGLQSAPSSRGVALLLDGLPLGLADGSFNSSLVDPQLAERIEVDRGLDAWRQTPATMGGALNLVAARGASSVPATVHAEGGSFGALRANASDGWTQADLSANGAVSFSRQDGYRDHSSQERSSFFGAVREAGKTGAQSTFSVYYARPDYDVPGPLTLALAQSAPRSVSTDVVRDQPRREAEVWQVAATTSTQTPDYTAEGGIAWLRTDDFFRQLQANGISDSSSDDVSLRGSIARRLPLAGGDHRIRLATTASRGWRESRRLLNDSGQTGALFGRDGLYSTTAMLSLADDVTLAPTLTATVGVAKVYTRRDVVDRMPAGTTPVPTTRSLGAAPTLPQASLRWSVRPEVVFFAGVSQAAEAPTFDDLIVVSGAYPKLSRRSQPLQTQRATTWEVGTRGAHGPFSWDVTAYRGDWTNEILRLADAKGAALGAVNAGPTRHLGVETTAHWLLLDQGHRLTLNVSGVWNRFYFENDPVFGRNRLAGAPPHVGSAELLYENPRGFFGAAGLDWTAGQTSVDHAGRMTYGGHTLAHLRAGWRSKAWTFFADVTNIFDERHIASTAGVLDIARNPAATSIFLPGAGRGFILGCEWRH